MRKFGLLAFALAILAGGLMPLDMDSLPVGDKALHAGAFAIYAVVARGTAWSAKATFASAAILAGVLEILQTLSHSRIASMFDWGFSLAGAGLGIAIAGYRVRQTRQLALAASLGCVVLADAAVAEVRPAVTSSLLEWAWRQAAHERQPTAPWPGAPARVAMQLSIAGEKIEIVDSSAKTALAIAPGLWNANADLKENLIVLGHRNREFRALGKLHAGDRLSAVTVSGREAHYEVVSIDIVRWDRSGIFPDTPVNGLTLVTCWPLDSTAPSDLRLVVRTRQVPDA